MRTFEKLPDTYKGLSAAAGLIAFGALLGGIFTGFTSLPEDVAANTVAIQGHDDLFEIMERNDSMIVARLDRNWCFQLLSDSIPLEERLRECNF